MKKNTLKAEIQGAGDSLWGKSDDLYSIDSYKVYMLDMEEGKGDEPYELQISGENTNWWQYTDKGICREIEKLFLPVLQEAYPNNEIQKICWSEQGMQPEDGWSFDIIIKSR